MVGEDPLDGLELLYLPRVSDRLVILQQQPVPFTCTCCYIFIRAVSEMSSNIAIISRILLTAF